MRLFGEELRAAKEALGAVVTLEAGKIVSEGLGEVQEMIDICDFAVGLSRQIYGLTIASRKPVVNQTGLTEKYNLLQKSMARNARRGNTEKDAFVRALSDQLGLELVPTNMPIEMLVVEKAK